MGASPERFWFWPAATSAQGVARPQRPGHVGVGLREQLGVVELGFVGEHVAVGVRRHGQVPLSDVLSDPRPWHAAQVKEADPSVSEVVRAEGRHAGRRARSVTAVRKRSPPKPWKTGRSGVRSSRATSAITASNRAGTTPTHLARPVLLTV